MNDSLFIVNLVSSVLLLS